MVILELTLILLGCTVVAAVFDQFITRVSLPLIQIAIGCVVALLVPDVVHVEMDPELFLILFIAPLLFDEARSGHR